MNQGRIIGIINEPLLKTLQCHLLNTSNIFTMYSQCTTLYHISLINKYFFTQKLILPLSHCLSEAADSHI